MPQRTTGKTVERTLLLVIFALMLFASPVIFLWAQDDSPWYFPYVLWAIVIAVTAWINRRRKHV